jgi:hypothetical protein
MAQSSEKLEPRYAKTADELIFFTNTDGERNYPIFLLPSTEIRYKRKPEGAEKFAVFYVKEIEIIAGKEERKVHERLAALLDVVRTAKEVGRSAEVYTYAIHYEVYKGDFEELVATIAVPYVKISVEPPFPASFDEKRAWAVAFTTRKRLLQKLPPDVAAYIEKRCYLKKYQKKRTVAVPYVFIKIPVVTPEFEAVFKKVLAWLTSAPASVASPAAAGAEEVDIEKLFEEPEELPAVSPQPSAQPAAVPVAPTAVGEEAEEEEEKEERATKEELVKLFLLNMRLPSKYLVQRVENERKGDTLVREVRRWEGEAARLATALQSLRWKAYDRMTRCFCYVEDFGVWVAVTEEAVKEAESAAKMVREELTKLGLGPIADHYIVRVVPVYLEPEDAKALLAAAVEHLSADAEELRSKIEEAEKEKKEKEVKKLKRKLAQVEQLLNQFLLEMRRRGW